MSSTPIPGWAYLLIGVSVSAFSKFVESKKAGTNLSIFFYIGLIFIAVGIFKIGIKYVTKKQSKNSSNPKKIIPLPRTSQIQNQNSGQIFQNPQNSQKQTNQGGFLRNEVSQNPSQLNSFQNNSQHHITKVTNSAQPEHPSIITCAGCGVKHYSYANFCMMCGLMIRKK